MAEPEPQSANSVHGVQRFPKLETLRDVSNEFGEGDRNSPQSPRQRKSSTASKFSVINSERLRSGTVRMINADVPSGMWSVTGQTLGRAPTLLDIRKGEYIYDEEGRQQALRERRESTVSPTSPTSPAEGRRPSHISSSQASGQVEVLEEHAKFEAKDEKARDGEIPRPVDSDFQNPLHLTLSGRYPNGYKFPPKHTWQQSTVIGLRSFWAFVRTIKGFLITLYALNVVAWGGMIFLLLVGGGDAYMCWLERPPNSNHWVQDCSSKQTAKSIWIEIDAQVLNALFCVTGFGLIPWRFRDLYFLLRFRLRGLRRPAGMLALRRLAAWHAGWFRLPGSDALDPLQKIPSGLGADDDDATRAALPEPVDKAPAAPLTGHRAPPTALWLLDFVVWMQVLNTFCQAALCGFMWGQDRYERAAWSTALFITMGCIVAMAAGLVQFREGKRIKAVEGIPLDVADAIEASNGAKRDVEKGEQQIGTVSSGKADVGRTT